MAKQPKIHTVYTLQVKANGTQQFNQATLDDMLESIGDTVKNWFPKGEVELTKHDVVDGDKRVVITNVFSRRSGAKEPVVGAKPRTAYEESLQKTQAQKEEETSE